MKNPDSPDQAIADARSLREHLFRKPDDGPAWLALAQLLARSAPGRELYHAIEQAIQSLPESTDAWLLAATVHQRQHGQTAAIRWLTHSARENPALRAPRSALALLRGDDFRLACQWQEALAEYRKVESERPRDPVLLNNIGSCLASLEEYDDAEGYFERALQQQPGFAEAGLNLGFLRACQGRDDDALRRIGAVLRDNGAAPDTREAARSLREILCEHRRLRPWLDQSLKTGAVGELQRELRATPTTLTAPHADSLGRLRALAQRCRSLVPVGGNRTVPASEGALAAVEAFTLCNLEGGAESIAALYAGVSASPVQVRGVSGNRRFDLMLSAIHERAGRDPADLTGAEGEAWLRYWHARLLRDEPERRPGQYKLSANAVRGLPLTPPARVAGTIRVVLADILPELPAGMPRGLFLYIAVNMIHPFGDGNGRLSRFLLAWESGYAGAPPLLVPLASRARTARALDLAWLEGQVEPLAETLQDSCAITDTLLAELHSRRPPD